MTNPMTEKLRHFAPLSREDEAAIDALCVDVRTHRAKRNLIKEGDRPEVVFLLLEGLACRYKILPNGARQIVAFLLPGDLCDVHIFILKEMDHSISLLSNAKVAAIPKAAMLELFETRPTLVRALWWATLTDESTLREWLLNIGQREAFDRLAHLIAELFLRMKMVGLASKDTFALPATQLDLADALGLTSVHLNRMLQRLRASRLVEIERGRVRVCDAPGLLALTRFDATYLHIDQGDRGPAANQG